MKFLMILFVFVLWGSDVLLAANLACSANGLEVIYINGVNTNEKKDYLQTMQLLTKKVDAIASDIDEKHIVNTSGIYNLSRGLLDDLEELKVQISANHSDKKRKEYWEEKAKDILNNTILPYEDYFVKQKKINDTIKQIVSKDYISYKTNSSDLNNPQVGDQNSYRNSDLYRDLVKYNSELARLYATANADAAVVEALKQKIMESYNLGTKKVLVVAHSQGNEVLYSAVNIIRNTYVSEGKMDELAKFDGVLGYLQIAPPSPELVPAYTSHRQYIRSDKDAVIALSPLITSVEPKSANYHQGGGYPKWMDFLTYDGISYNTIFNILGIKNSTQFFEGFHGMNSTYLSDSVTAIRNSTGKNQEMEKHFKDNMREIASELVNNCLPVPTISPQVFSGYSYDRLTIPLSIAFTNDGYNRVYTNVVWDFGDGTPPVTVKGSDLGKSNTHTYATYGVYHIKVKIFYDNFSNVYNLEQTAYVEPPFETTLLSGEYRVMTLYDTENKRYGGMLHSRTATFKMVGPLGAARYFSGAGGDNIYTLNCGSWSKTDLITCTRKENQPIETTVYFHSVEQCGGEGCIYPVVSSFAIPWPDENRYNIPQFDYTGDLPKPFDF
jgi:hypothetical protein